MKYLISLLLLFGSTTAWSCSCYQSAFDPVAPVLMWHPNLVEGQVVGKQTLGATLSVTKVHKGAVHSDEITVVHAGCWASLSTDDMEMGHTYVLPLPEPEPEAPELEGFAMVELGPGPGEYALPVCGHSGLEVIDGEVYSFGYDESGQRRLEHYMSYSAFGAWMGVLAVVEAVLFIFRQFGLLSVMLTVVVGTAGAYFAGRNRPWVLVPLLLVATLLCALNLRNMLSGEPGAVYWVLSWLALAIILGGAVLGYLTRRRAIIRA